MDPKNIVLLGVKSAVIAFDKESGRQLWTARLNGAFGSNFVTVAADDARVYAHHGGVFHCLDLKTGKSLWSDELAGMGYGLASIALPGAPTAVDPLVEKLYRDNKSAHAASHSS